jgi:hypothetical protein
MLFEIRSTVSDTADNAAHPPVLVQQKAVSDGEGVVEDEVKQQVLPDLRSKGFLSVALVVHKLSTRLTHQFINAPFPPEQQFPEDAQASAGRDLNCSQIYNLYLLEGLSPSMTICLSDLPIRQENCH